MINNVVLVGRTTKDIELKENKNGNLYVQFTLAVNRPFKDGNGEQQADFIQCVAWNKTAETLSKYVSKGTLIGIEGRLQVRSYEEAGIRKYISEVIVNRFTFLESRRSNIPEPIEPNPATSLNYPSIGYGYNESEATYRTATTMVGSITQSIHTIGVSDDDFPF